MQTNDCISVLKTIRSDNLNKLIFAHLNTNSDIFLPHKSKVTMAVVSCCTLGKTFLLTCWLEQKKSRRRSLC